MGRNAVAIAVISPDSSTDIGEAYAAPLGDRDPPTVLPLSDTIRGPIRRDDQGYPAIVPFRIKS